MKKLNLYLTLSSISVILISIERFSFTTKIVLQPYYFLRLHEFVQILLLIFLTVIVPCLLFYEITHKLESVKLKYGLALAIVFITGIYFYSTGNGIHEMASYIFNTFCPQTIGRSHLCQSVFFNDYYFGNILYFLGGALMNISLIIYEILHPNKLFSRKDFKILLINSLIYSLAIFAYAAFDRVLVGLVYSFIMMIAVNYLLLRSRKKYTAIPFTFYCAIAYTIGTIASLILRFFSVL